ncbi:carboxypeptidase M32 [Bacillus sp. HMF5848]|uniref:carboxypeptidase M32 n=1 Tax=Bacillus sp. HMF5848 TaxID=2495421 RepID=UPI000F776C6E|nr:carboxypeptidase M32 [Bacillus sp. HMF5848]RSK25829.1 carboxypeptidase M32 [Bacillus sp. HMF5848]
MNEQITKRVEQFKKLDEKITHLSSISGLIGWDEKVMAPKKGRPIFAKAIGTLQTEIFSLSVSEEMGALLEELTEENAFQQLDDVTKARVRERATFYKKSNQIPASLYNEYSITCSEAGIAWEQARKDNDFNHFAPFLEKIVAYKKQFAEIFGYEKHPYDALLDEFEPGLTVEKLDPIFSELRKSSVALLHRIQQSSSVPNKEIFEQDYNIEAQKQFNRYILPLIGFDLEAGRLDETVHPFAQTINTHDVRITTRYLKDNVRSAIFGTIHEAGHGIYEQQVDPNYEGTVLQSGTSFGIHESQSRFLENMVGRSKAFWTYFYPALQKHFPDQLKEVSLDEFYRAVNLVEPSFIRVEADELTYNLHIMIRYEIEKGLISGEIAVTDLPKIWNEKVEEYLGITPPNDTLGVLQDVHWSFGGIGYFPSYSLGNLYAAQILYTITKEIPDFYEEIAKGNFAVIQSWLREKIHQHGKFYTPDELIVRVTGEELNASYLVQYLEDKYKDVYNL